ncbi:MAG: sulfotransferase domain-containing protein [Pseudomonadota bacterium]
MEQYVIIIGAMKCGTTTLFDHLAQHPEIAPSTSKEPGFFALDEVWDKGWDWYHSLFPFDPGQHRYRLEASTDYTKAPFVSGVWDRMTSRPDVSVRLVYITRDPLRRMESHARYVQHTRREIGRRPSPRPDHGLDAGVSAVSLAISRYAFQLGHFEAAHAAGALHVLALEDLKRNPSQTLTDLYRFLDLSPHLPSEQGVEASNSAANPHKRMPKIWNRMTRNAGVVRAVKALIPASVQARIKAGLRKPIQVEGRFAFTPEEDAALRPLFHDDAQELKSRWGLDTSGLWDQPRDQPRDRS